MLNILYSVWLWAFIAAIAIVAYAYGYRKGFYAREETARRNNAKRNA